MAEVLRFGTSVRVGSAAVFPTLLLLGGCQAILEVTTSEPAASDARDAAPIPTDGSCTADMPFKAPEYFSELNSEHTEEGLRILDGGLRAQFWSDRRTPDPVQRLLSFDVFTATRASTDQPFGPPQLFVPLSTPLLGELYPAETADGLTIYFDRNSKTEPKPEILPERHILRMRRTAKDQPFGPREEVSGLRSLENLQAGDVTPYVVPDGGALYFASNRFASGGVQAILDTDIFKTVLVDGRVVSVEHVQSVSMRGEADLNPVVTPDELTLYLASTRPGGPRYLDIWVATRPSRDVPFSTPRVVSELSSFGQDAVTDVSPDNCVVYGYTSGPNFNDPSADMFRAVRKR
jgi:hypothetical protein